MVVAVYILTSNALEFQLFYILQRLGIGLFFLNLSLSGKMVYIDVSDISLCLVNLDRSFYVYWFLSVPLL
jgi:hypothetical protein